MMDVTQHFAPTIITGLVSAAIISATMSSADSNLLCMSTMFINDIYTKYFRKENPLTDKQVIFATRACNVIASLIAIAISLGGVDIVTMNTFAFAIRCAGPFAAYGLGMVVPRATKASGQISIVTGTIGVIVWQILSGGNFYLGILPVVFGCAVGTITFFLVNLIQWNRGVDSAPSAFLSDAEVKAIEKKEAEERMR